MSCCGQQKPDRNVPPPSPARRPSASATAALPQQFAAIFQYVGPTALSVVGPVSGRLYRFNGPGSKERVDLRDRPGLLQVPVLREVS